MLYVLLQAYQWINQDKRIKIYIATSLQLIFGALPAVHVKVLGNLEPWGEEDETDKKFEPPILATYTKAGLAITDTSTHDQTNLATTTNGQDKKEGVELLQLQADGIPEWFATSGSTTTTINSQYKTQPQQDESCTPRCIASTIDLCPETATSESFEGSWVSSNRRGTLISQGAPRGSMLALWRTLCCRLFNGSPLTMLIREFKTPYVMRRAA